MGTGALALVVVAGFGIPARATLAVWPEAILGLPQ